MSKTIVLKKKVSDLGTYEASTDEVEVDEKGLEYSPETIFEHEKYFTQDCKLKISIRYAHNNEYIDLLKKLGRLGDLQKKVEKKMEARGLDVWLLTQFYGRLNKIQQKISRATFNRYRNAFLNSRKYKEKKKNREHQGEKIDISHDGMKVCKNLSNNSWKVLQSTKKGYRSKETYNFLYENYNSHHSSESKKNLAKEYARMDKIVSLKGKNILSDYSGALTAISDELEKKYNCKIFFSKNSQNRAKMEKTHEYLRTEITRKTSKKDSKDDIITLQKVKKRINQLKKYCSIDNWFIEH